MQKGNTALHYVCQRKSHRLVPLLLQKHANVHIRNEVGLWKETGRSCAGSRSPTASFALLQDGETPLDIATRLKFNNIVSMLRKTQ